MEKNLEELLKSDNLDTLQMAFHLAVGMGDEMLKEQADFAYMNAWIKQQKSLRTIVLCGPTKMMERIEALRSADAPELPEGSTWWVRVKAHAHNPVSRIETIAKYADEIKKPDEERVKMLEQQIMFAATYGSDSRQVAGRLFRDNQLAGRFAKGGVEFNPKYSGEFQLPTRIVIEHPEV